MMLGGFRRNGRVIDEGGTGVHLNLASEEAVLLLAPSLGHEVTVRFWRNEPSVILGRSLDLAEEVDTEYCAKHGIVIARRVSGGGAVYHDLGNLNVSFFVSKACLPTSSKVDEVNTFFTNIMKNSLIEVGIDSVDLRGGSNLFHRGQKVSGSAACHKASWVLHHATLLLAVDLERVDKALLASRATTRGSVHAPVVNLPLFPVDAWKASVIKELSTKLAYPVTFVPSVLEDEEHRLAARLLQETYRTERWIEEKRHASG